MPRKEYEIDAIVYVLWQNQIYEGVITGVCDTGENLYYEVKASYHMATNWYHSADVFGSVLEVLQRVASCVWKMDGSAKGYKISKNEQVR